MANKVTMAYVIKYKANPLATSHLSQEAYWTLEKAQKFVEGRSNNPEKYSAYYYQTVLGEEYYIRPVTLHGEKEESR